MTDEKRGAEKTPYDLKQYKDQERARRVHREFLIDRSLTGYSDKEYEEAIRNSELNKRDLRKGLISSMPSYNGISEFSYFKYKRYPHPSTTFAIERYLVSKHSLPEQFFATDDTLSSLGRTNLETHISHLKKPDIIHERKYFYHNFVCGTHIFTGSPVFNFALGLLIEWDDTEKYFRVTAVSESDQEERELEVELDTEIDIETLLPEYFSRTYYKGAAYPQGNEINIILTNFDTGLETSIELPLEFFRVRYGWDLGYVDYDDPLLVSFDSDPKHYSVLESSERDKNRMTLKYLKPTGINGMYQNSIRLLHVCKSNPILSLNNDQVRLAISECHNIFLRGHSPKNQYMCQGELGYFNGDDDNKYMISVAKDSQKYRGYFCRYAEKVSILDQFLYGIV